MASKKPVEVQEEEQQTVSNEDRIAAQAAEIERLRAELAKAKPAQRAARPARESDYDRVHRLEAEAIAAGKDMWEEWTEVYVPHRNPTEDPFYWMCINSRPVQFPANDTVQEMRLPYACLLVDVLRNEKRAADYKDSMQVYDPVTNPHKEEMIRSGY